MRVSVKGTNALFGCAVESHTTLAITRRVLIDGSRNPTVFPSSLAVAEGGVGCSPGMRVTRAVKWWARRRCAGVLGRGRRS